MHAFADDLVAHTGKHRKHKLPAVYLNEFRFGDNRFPNGGRRVMRYFDLRPDSPLTFVFSCMT